MGMLGSRSFYAERGSFIFEFQDKKFRDWFVKHNEDANIISSKDVWSKDEHRPKIWVSYWNFRKSRAFKEA